MLASTRMVVGQPRSAFEVGGGEFGPLRFCTSRSCNELQLFSSLMSVPNPALRQEVIKIYKGSNGLVTLSVSQAHSSLELLYLIREYPLGYDYARSRLHKAFISQADLRDEEQIKKGVQRAEFVKKGT